MTYFACARTALRMALQTTQVPRGEKILLPDFVCDVLLHPLRQLGLVPIYYPVTQALSPDWRALEAVATEVHACALVMPHYFGQPQDIERFRSLCSAHRLLLIEDNAHGYGGTFKGRPLGSFGDIGISSPRKILGTPSGGILHNVDTLSAECTKSLKPYPVYRPRSLIKMTFRNHSPVWRFAKGMATRNCDWNDPHLFRESVQPDYRIDGFSRRRIMSADWNGIASRRRKAWFAWDRFARSKKLSPIFSDAYSESCPWAMPVYAKDTAERNRWLTWGAKNGIPLFPWPTLPEEIITEEGEALARWRRLICFPLDSTPEELGIRWQ